MFNQNKVLKDRLIQGLALVGISATIALLMWGGVQIVRFGPSVASGVFNNVSSNITAAVVQLNSVLIPKKDTEESFNSGTESGSLFVVVEDSEDEVVEEIEDQQENELETISQEQSIASSDSGVSEDTTPPTSPATIKGERSDRTFQISVEEEPAEDPDGEVDLAIRNIETGIFNKDTEEFTVTDSLKVSDCEAVQYGAIQFEVINLGTKKSDKWVFSATLPTDPAYIFNSPLIEEGRGPGGRMEFILCFDNVIHKSEGTITINVDPDENLQEVTRDNNVVNKIIQIDFIEN